MPAAVQSGADTDDGPDGSADAGGPALRDAFEREGARLLAPRIQLTACLLLLLLGAGDLLEAVQHPDRRVLVLSVYAATATAWLLAMLACRLTEVSRVLLAVVPSAVTAILLNAYTAAINGPAERLAMAQVCLLTGLAVLLPWGWHAQLVVGLVTLLTFVGVVPALTAAEDMGFPLIGLLTAVVNSLGGAFLLERSRWTEFRQAARLREEADVAAALGHVGETLSLELNHPDLLEKVNHLSIELLECNWSTTFFVNARREAQHASSAGSPPAVRAELENLLVPIDRVGLVHALRPGRTVEFADVDDQSLMPAELMKRLAVSSALYAPLTRDGEVIGVLANGYTKRKGPFSMKQRRLALGIAHAAEIALENARLITDLTAASRLKSEFVATMSHELRTPLNVIMGYTELLAEQEFGALTSAQQAAVASTRRSARELLDLVSATLDLNRLDAGRDALQLTSVDVGDLFAELEGELRPLCAPAVALGWRSLLGNRCAHSDRAKLKTILKNLVGNALKFTDGGSVDVEARCDGRTLELRVRDTGLGIGPEHLPVIFEMFRQADGSSTRRHGGVGLGLHIVDRLVSALGGAVTVDSRPGAGSTFTVRLPNAVHELSATGT